MKKTKKNDPTYAIQVCHPVYGWVGAGNYNVRDEAHGRQLLEQFRKPFGNPKTYRLIKLVPQEIARVRSRKDDR